MSTRSSDTRTAAAEADSRVRLVLFVALGGLLAFGLFAFAWSGGLDGRRPCTLEGRFVENIPDGWTLQRDNANGCAWTLYNEHQERAPKEIYQGLEVEYPGSPLFYPLRLLGLGATLGSITGLGILLSRILHSRNSASDVTQRRNATNA